jgi:hypothetical protein
MHGTHTLTFISLAKDDLLSRNGVINHLYYALHVIQCKEAVVNA